MAYEAARGQVVMFGGYGDFTGELTDTWTFRYRNGLAEERCRYGLDGDDDGKIGCADPDCFGYCSPLCNPTLMTCGTQAPRCGDGTCQSYESSRLCPMDCGAPTPACGDFLCESPETIVNCPGDCS